MRENLHAGRRERMKKKFRRDGLDSFEEHEVLELLLYFALPRVDTNEIAHRLLQRFKTLHGVFNADISDLCEVEGIGDNAALLLSLMPGITQRYLQSRVIKSARLSDSASFGDFFLPYFIGKHDEVVYLLCLNNRFQPICCELIHSGSVNAALVSIPRVVSQAVKSRATFVVLAHNHPGGFAIPSKEDLETTLLVKDALEKVNVKLLDHIIISDPLSETSLNGEFVSLSDSGLFDR